LLARSEEEAHERRAASSEPDSPWHRVDGWRLNGVGHQTLRLVLDQRIIEIDARPSDRGHRLAVGDLEFEASAVRLDDGRCRIQLDGDTSSARFLAVGATIHAMGAFGHHRVQLFDPLAAAAPSDEAEGALIAPMPGKVVRQLVTAGQEVPRGTPLLVLEAMKMEHTIRAPADGRIETLHCQEGDQVEEGVVLLEFEADADG
jgi:3-methylcrotonyl-CoA carboxylase alpha subunit